MSATKIGKNTINILKLLYFTINLHFVTSNLIFTDRKLNLSFTSSIYVAFVALECKNDSTDQNIPRLFLLYLKRNEPQTFTSVSCKHSFLQCVRYSYSLLRWIFFYVITGRHYFSWKINVNLRFFLSAMLLLSLNQCFERSPYFMRYFHNNNMMVIPKFQNKT